MRKKLAVSALLVLLAVGYLGYVGFGKSASYYLTVSQLAGKSDLGYDKVVRVNGDVVPGSIVRSDGSGSIEFAIADEGASLRVVYDGVVPDTFRDGLEVVVEGKRGPDGVLRADGILTKCPSKYEADGSESNGVSEGAS